MLKGKDLGGGGIKFEGGSSRGVKIGEGELGRWRYEREGERSSWGYEGRGEELGRWRYERGRVREVEV